MLYRDTWRFSWTEEEVFAKGLNAVSKIKVMYHYYSTVIIYKEVKQKEIQMETLGNSSKDEVVCA